MICQNHRIISFNSSCIYIIFKPIYLLFKSSHKNFQLLYAFICQNSRMYVSQSILNFVYLGNLFWRILTLFWPKIYNNLTNLVLFFSCVFFILLIKPLHISLYTYEHKLEITAYILCRVYRGTRKQKQCSGGYSKKNNDSLK